jgi:hypothetical protein
MISKTMKAAIKLGETPAYRIAQRAGIDPTTLSKIMCGIIKVKKNDPRVIAVGRVLGIPADECFDGDEQL